MSSALITMGWTLHADETSVFLKGTFCGGTHAYRIRTTEYTSGVNGKISDMLIGGM